MKRRREGGMEKGCSEIRSAIEELSLLKPDGLISTNSFLSVSNLVLQVLDKIGPTMAVLRHDVHQNIQRVEELYESDPSIYSSLVEMIKKEVGEGSARKTSSCTRALLWLTRSMDFSVALLDKLARDPTASLQQIVEESYEKTLKPWHGWISSAAYKVALKLVPESKAFIGLLIAQGEDYKMFKEEVHTFVSSLLPHLNEIHDTLGKFCLDRIKAT